MSSSMRRGCGIAAWTMACVWLAASPGRAEEEPALVSPDQGRVHVDASIEHQLRMLADGFDPARAYLSQSAWVLGVEAEADLLTEAWGPIELLSGFARLEVRYDCVYNGCGTLGAERMFGDFARVSPARNWANATTLERVGPYDLRGLGIPVQHVQKADLDLRTIAANPGFAPIFAAGIDPAIASAAFGPVEDDLFSWKRIHVAGQDLAVPLGPWPYAMNIEPNGALRHESSTTSPLPLRPATESLYTPSAALRRENQRFGSFDTNFGEHELAWNHGASQSETYELKEAYLDFEMFESRLWIRAGKQNIVWGKTELFRTTDQFNPVDLALASLPSLEESRIALFSVRGTWSFYDVGPLQDLRLELAANLDRFEPIDLGRCGEPYTVWPVCGKSTGLWAHGTTGTGLAGEVRPPSAWEDVKGVEVGARIEFRWDRFSFAVSDFYGYDDVPTVDLFNEYQRNVDVQSGRPLDAASRPLTPDNALDFASGNRQAFDLGCKASLGFGEQALDRLFPGNGIDLSDRCLGDLLNLQEDLVLGLTVPEAVGALLAGQPTANGLGHFLQSLLEIPVDQQVNLVPLNRDPNDGPGAGLLPLDSLSFHLTDEQEALLGCGTFYATNCDTDGIDLFNAEASVVLQSFPGLSGNPVATRFEDGQLHVLPGARGPGDPDWNVNVDGSPPPGFSNEMAAVSYNVAVTIALLGIAEGDTQCDLVELETCAAIRALVALSGSRRPEVRAGGNGRFGRRDWSWHGGGEAALIYPKRNVLGFAFDFAEDRTRSAWSFEFTWIDSSPFASNQSADGNQRTDVFNLTVSVDRPTFVNFLNANRTFFLNSQLFFRYVPDHDSSFDTSGPLSMLGTFAIATGYYQDRLLPSLVLVHDVASASGGVISQITYRFTEDISATVGALAFYGSPDDNHLPLHPISLPDATTDFDTRTRFDGLSAIAEREELFLRLRWTF